MKRKYPLLDEHLRTLNHLARLASSLNALAKKLNGNRDRESIYRAKAAVCGVALALNGVAVKGIRPEGFVGLEILSDPRVAFTSAFPI